MLNKWQLLLGKSQGKKPGKPPGTRKPGICPRIRGYQIRSGIPLMIILTLHAGTAEQVKHFLKAFHEIRNTSNGTFQLKITKNHFCVSSSTYDLHRFCDNSAKNKTIFVKMIDIPAKEKLQCFATQNNAADIRILFPRS